jgi:hypothetical protein
MVGDNIILLIVATEENKKWQVTYIAPLNRLSLLHSCPGEVQQELVV